MRLVFYCLDQTRLRSGRRQWKLSSAGPLLGERLRQLGLSGADAWPKLETTKPVLIAKSDCFARWWMLAGSDCWTLLKALLTPSEGKKLRFSTFCFHQYLQIWLLDIEFCARSADSLVFFFPIWTRMLWAELRKPSLYCFFRNRTSMWSASAPSSKRKMLSAHFSTAAKLVLRLGKLHERIFTMVRKFWVSNASWNTYKFWWSTGISPHLTDRQTWKQDFRLLRSTFQTLAFLCAFLSRMKSRFLLCATGKSTF